MAGSEMQPEKEEEELTVLEYARYYGLCIDYLTDDPLDVHRVPQPPTDILSPLGEPQNTIQIELASEGLPKERLTVDKDAALFLRDVTTLAQAPAESDWLPEQTNKFSGMKQELPILRTDNDSDLHKFAKQTVPDLHNVKFPLEQLDVETGEGVAWPRKHLELPAQYDARVKAEKLEVSKDVLLYLQETLKDSFAVEDEEATIAEELRYERNGALDPVTPPLLPLSPPSTPFVPASPVNHLELLSDCTDPTVEETQTLEMTLMQQDRILPIVGDARLDSNFKLPDSDNIGQVYSPLRFLTELTSSSSPPLKHPRPEDLRVEGPLTPPMNLQPPAKKAKFVSFSEILHKYIPDLPSTFTKIDEGPTSEDEYNAFFNDVIEPIATEAKRESEQEQLQEADSTLRAEVPVMDFSTTAVPPWKVYGLKASVKCGNGETELVAQRRLLSMIKNEHFKNNRHWGGLSKIERQLHWSPFPMHLGKVAAEEAFDDDGSLDRYLAALNFDDATDSGTLVWKPDGLRALDEDEESDEDLEPTVFEPERKDMQSLIRKRRMDIEEYGENIQPGQKAELLPQKEAPPDLTKSPKVAQSKAFLPPAAEMPTKSDGDLMFGDFFSASNALSKFMKVQGGVSKKPRLIEGAKIPAASVLPQIADTKVAQSVVMAEESGNIPRGHLEEVMPLPTLDLTVPTATRPFIMSSTLLTQRSLMRRIRALYPSAEIIERDFTMNAGTISFSEKQKQPTQTGDEPDLLLSSGVGLVWTTLQKIKQRALPGQTSKSAIKERIARIAGRYEKLVILVSEGRSGSGEAQGVTTGPPTLDERDCDALTDLMVFAATAVTNISVSYVAGGEEQLTQWILGSMIKYGDCRPEARLLQDETLWELFLRHAGMNAFAAQAILSELKAPTEAEDSSAHSTVQAKGASFGLAAFVAMTAQERLRKFEALLGGGRVLRRIATSTSVLLNRAKIASSLVRFTPPTI
ncbi:hypothetical protein B0A49_12276 [Cryomyces minteri]|uniref:Uncharacterized protein n=1 Tax=Cryomyces minteri TaxID=331657 RepID=A0A4U0WHM0_9PEZI|nr:hypothetical protein B0A49_12276 [Cryomyces minteri]